MSTPSALMRMGLPSQQAKRLGIDAGTGSSNLNGGAAFASAAAIGQFQLYVRANCQTSANIFQLPSNAEIGTPYTIFNAGAVSGAVYPPVNGTVNINAGATASLVTLAIGKGLFFVAITASTFDVMYSN
jgi:hypothetical protein